MVFYQKNFKNQRRKYQFAIICQGQKPRKIKKDKKRPKCVILIVTLFHMRVIFITFGLAL